MLAAATRPSVQWVSCFCGLPRRLLHVTQGQPASNSSGAMAAENHGEPMPLLPLPRCHAGCLALPTLPAPPPCAC